MASGYTSGVADGTVKTFEQFAMTCARAFGACVTLRESDAPIPDKFEPDLHYKKRADEARKRRDELAAMMPEQKQVGADEENARAIRVHTDYCDRMLRMQKRYEAMLQNVNKWTPPTPEHIRLKEFMQEQLLESLEWDCTLIGKTAASGFPTAVTADEWWARQMSYAEQDVQHSEREYEEECQRMERRTAWIKALRDSLRAENETPTKNKEPAM